MELKQFIKGVLNEALEAIQEAESESGHSMELVGGDQRTIEFDIAATVEDASSSSGGAGIKIFQVVTGGCDLSKELRNSSVSRIKFGVYVNSLNKDQEIQRRNELRQAQQTSYE